MVILKKEINKSIGNDMEKRDNPCALLVGILTDATTMENSTEVSQKIKVVILYDQ